MKYTTAMHHGNFKYFITYYYLLVLAVTRVEFCRNGVKPRINRSYYVTKIMSQISISIFVSVYLFS